MASTFSAWLHELAHFSDGEARGRPPIDAGDRVLGRYDVLRLLGHGGMGFVYEAFDREREVTCALKTLRDLRPERILMLKNEFRSIGRVQHSHLVRPGELFEEGGRWFFTMELVRGEEPAGWADGREERVRHVIGGLADVLATMHAEGVMHRDVKPSNVIVGAPDRVVLIDLGLARDTERPLWFDRDEVGTTLYMAPELAAAASFSPAADMYSLGVLLYELAVGRVPDRDQVPSLAASRPDFSADFDDVCAALLQPDPGARPGARELAARLRGRVAPSVAPGVRTLIGRDRELARLRAATMCREKSRLTRVLVHGPPGTGKSALLDQFRAEKAAAGALVLAGRCYERESVPHKALDGIIDDLAAVLARRPDLRLAIPEESAPLGAIFPALATFFPEASRAPVARDQVAQSFREFLAGLAAVEPVMLVIDDLQWADPDGLQLLSVALEGPAAPPLLLIASGRDIDAPEPLSSRDGTITIECGPLAAGDAAILAASLGLDTIEQRATALDPAGGELLSLVTVGAPLPYPVLAVACGVPVEELERQLATLEEQRLIRRTGAGAHTAADVFHDQVRHTLLAQMTGTRLTSLHRSLAEAYAIARPDAHARLARHYEGAADASRAYHHACIAASGASDDLAFAHAADLYAIAIDHAPAAERPALLVHRADALALAWHPLEAARAYSEAASNARVADARVLRMRAVEQSLLGGDLELGLAELTRALRAAGIRTPRRAWSALTTALLRRLRLRLPRVRVLDRSPDPADIDLLWSAALALAMIDALLALGYHSRSLHLADVLADPVRLARSMSLEACIQAGSASLAEAERLIARADQLAGDHPVGRLHSRAAKIVLAVQRGHWREGLALAADDDRAHHTPWHSAARELYQAHCEYNLGLFVELGARCDRASHDVRRRNDRFLELAMNVSFAPVVQLVRDDAAGARDAIARGEELLWRGGRGGYFHALAAVASLFTDLYDEAYDRAAAWRGPGSASLARRSHYGRVYLEFLGASVALGALCTGGASRRLDARVAKAVRRLERDPIPWASPYAHLLAAQRAHLAGRAGERDRRLPAAREQFAALRCAHMVDVVDRAVAIAAGVDPRAAETRLRERGMVRPDRFAQMLAPSFR